MNKEELIKKFEKDMSKRNRWMRFILVFDQMLNVIFMNGSQDETISSHIARNQESGKSTRIQDKICKFLKKLEKNHCKKSKGE